MLQLRSQSLGVNRPLGYSWCSHETRMICLTTICTLWRISISPPTPTKKEDFNGWFWNTLFYLQYSTARITWPSDSLIRTIVYFPIDFDVWIIRTFCLIRTEFSRIFRTNYPGSWQGPLLIILLFMLVGYLITEFLIYGMVSTSSSRVVIQSQECHEIGYRALTQQGEHMFKNPLKVYYCSFQYTMFINIRFIETSFNVPTVYLRATPLVPSHSGG